MTKHLTEESAPGLGVFHGQSHLPPPRGWVLGNVVENYSQNAFPLAITAHRHADCEHGICAKSRNPVFAIRSAILRTKLQRPPVAADILPRSRLLDRLNKGCQRTLTLISAPEVRWHGLPWPCAGQPLSAREPGLHELHMRKMSMPLPGVLASLAAQAWREETSQEKIDFFRFAVEDSVVSCELIYGGANKAPDFGD